MPFKVDRHELPHPMLLWRLADLQRVGSIGNLNQSLPGTFAGLLDGEDAVGTEGEEPYSAVT